MNLVTNIATAGGVFTVVLLALLMIARVLWTDRSAERRLDEYTRTLEKRVQILEAYVPVLTSALIRNGIAVPAMPAAGPPPEPAPTPTPERTH
jgi:TctA family transporter